MGFKSFKVVHFEQLLDGYGDDDDNSEWKNNSCFTCSSQVLPGFTCSSQVILAASLKDLEAATG